MGNDGGSIPTRRELVKNAARLPTVSELKATALEALEHSWKTDPVSGEPLDLENVVSDWRGRLYNYETVLQGLTSAKSEDGASVELLLDEVTNGRDVSFAETGIRSIRDIVRLQGTPYKAAATAATAAAESGQRWQCPVTLKALGPLGKSIYVVPCGHVFSEAAMATITTDKLCPACSTAVEPSNIVTILPSDKADVLKLRKRVEALGAQGLTHSLKKEKKDKSDKKDRKDKHNKKKRKAGDGEDEAAEKEVAKKATGSGASDKTGLSSRINNSMTASVTARVMAEQEALQKRRKMEARAQQGRMGC